MLKGLNVLKGLNFIKVLKGLKAEGIKIKKKSSTGIESYEGIKS